MLTGYVGKQIKRTNRNLLIVNLFLVAVVLAVFVASLGYIANCIHGPTPATVFNLIKINDANAAPFTFVRVPIDRQQLDPQAYQITGDNQNDWYHFLHVTPDRVLTIENGAAELPAEIEGYIKGTGGQFESMVLPAVSGQVKGSMGNIILDTSSYRAELYVGLAFAIPTLTLAAWNIWKAVRRARNPLLHPVAVQLAKIGPPEEIAVAVDAEMEAGSQKVGKVLTTTSWLARPRRFGLDLVYLGDIAWAYKQEIKHKKYGITVSKTYATVIHDVHGRQVTFALSQKQVDSLIAELSARVPWAYAGFDPRWKLAWKSQRPQFLAALEARKQALLAQKDPADA